MVGSREREKSVDSRFNFPSDRDWCLLGMVWGEITGLVVFCYTKCCPRTSSMSVSWELGTNAASQAPPQAH